MASPALQKPTTPGPLHNVYYERVCPGSQCPVCQLPFHIPFGWIYWPTYPLFWTPNYPYLRSIIIKITHTESSHRKTMLHLSSPDYHRAHHAQDGRLVVHLWRAFIRSVRPMRLESEPRIIRTDFCDSICAVSCLFVGDCKFAVPFICLQRYHTSSPDVFHPVYIPQIYCGFSWMVLIKMQCISYTTTHACFFHTSKTVGRGYTQGGCTVPSSRISQIQICSRKGQGGWKWI